VSGHLYFPAALNPGKEPPLPIGPVWTTGARKLLTLPGLELLSMGRSARSQSLSVCAVPTRHHSHLIDVIRSASQTVLWVKGTQRSLLYKTKSSALFSHNGKPGAEVSRGLENPRSSLVHVSSCNLNVTSRAVREMPLTILHDRHRHRLF
jgi:hypothetical protein